MRVAMYYNNHDVRVEEMPVPEIGPGELLVKVEASGICSTRTERLTKPKRSSTASRRATAGSLRCRHNLFVVGPD